MCLALSQALRQNPSELPAVPGLPCAEHMTSHLCFLSCGAEEGLEDSVKYFNVRPLIQEAAEQAIQKSLEASIAK